MHRKRRELAAGTIGGLATGIAFGVIAALALVWFLFGERIWSHASAW